MQYIKCFRPVETFKLIHPGFNPVCFLRQLFPVCIVNFLDRSMVGDFKRHQNVLVIDILEHLDEHLLQVIKEPVIQRLPFSGHLYPVNDQRSVLVAEIQHVDIAYPFLLSEYPDIEETVRHELPLPQIRIGAVL